MNSMFSFDRDKTGFCERNRSLSCIQIVLNLRMKKLLLVALVLGLFSVGCKKEKGDSITNVVATGPNLIFKFKFDSTQIRLDNLGNPATLPSGHSGISPVFNSMSTHYIELAPDEFTFLGQGEIAYKGLETTLGGDTAVSFQHALIAENELPFLSIPISEINPGTYRYLRSSLTYQNYDVPVRHLSYDLNMTLASFVGFNTYLTDVLVKTKVHLVNANKLQGYWIFEIDDSGFPITIPTEEGQAPAGATTVPNPLFASSPIPAGSCVVTGEFPTPLSITGNESEDITITLSVSINQSFEFIDATGDGIFEPAAGDTVVDMGIRGMIPYVNL